MRVSGRTGDAALLLLAVVVLAGAVAVLRGYTLDGAPRVVAQQPAPPRQVLAVVDDLAGPADAVAGTSAIEQAASSLGWELTLVPARGVGYTAAPPGQTNLAGLVEQSLPEGTYDLVVLQAGAPDAQAGLGEVGAGALGTLRRLRDRVGASARIVLVGPTRSRGVAEQLAGVREVLEAVAARERVLFLDPVEEGWLTGDAPLTEALQQRELAGRLEAAMRELRLAG